MRRLHHWLLLPVLLCAFGCHSTEDTVGGVRRANKVQSIVSLSPSTTELVASVATYSTLKGRTQADDWPVGSITHVPVVASVKPDYEKIAQIKPDLVVFDASTYSQQDTDKIKGLGFPTFTVTGNTIDEYIDSLYKMAAAIGCETSMSDYIEKVYAARATAKGDALAPAPKVAVMMAGTGGAQHYIAGTKSFVADAVKVAGGELVGPESDKFEIANPEFLVAQNPDIIVVGVPPHTQQLGSTDHSTDLVNVKFPGNSLLVVGAVDNNKDQVIQNLSAVYTDPRLKTVKAVRTGGIIGVDEDVLVRRGKRVDVLLDMLHKSLAAKVAGQ